MSNEIDYTLTLGVSKGADIDGIEEKLQDILLDLYDKPGVESIRVTKDGYVTDDKTVNEILDVIDDVDSYKIRQSIDLVKEMEDFDQD